METPLMRPSASSPPPRSWKHRLTPRFDAALNLTKVSPVADSPKFRALLMRALRSSHRVSTGSEVPMLIDRASALRASIADSQRQNQISTDVDAYRNRSSQLGKPTAELDGLVQLLQAFRSRGIR